MVLFGVHGVALVSSVLLAFGLAPALHAQAGDRRAELSAAVQQALLAQRAAWQAVERREHGDKELVAYYQSKDRRHYNYLCAWDGWRGNRGEAVRRLGLEFPEVNTMLTVAITGGPNKGRTICPDWIPPARLTGRTHERLGEQPDAAELAPFPAPLVSMLRNAHQESLNDEWVLRQLVRVLTANHQLAEAQQVTSACRSKGGWCALLDGYVLVLSGRQSEGLRAIRAAMSTLSPLAQCEWRTPPNRYPELVTSSAIETWCSSTRQTSESTWWLATPFYADSVDSRRLEHFRRHVLNAMAMDLPLDAHFDLRPKYGADVVVRMRLQYGSPSHQFYMGRKADTHWFKVMGARPPWDPPYTLAEYTPDRVATLPAPRAAAAPFSVNDDDFQFTAPDSVSPARTPVLRVVDGSYRGWWWPDEHMKWTRGAIERIAHQQRALLRRDSTAILLLASDLRDGRIDSIGITPVRAALVLTPNPDSVAILAQQITTRGSTVVLHGEFGSPGIAGFEYLVDAHGLAGGRTRFGIEHLPTLSALAPTTCAISDPLLTRADALTGNGITDAFTGLLGSLTLDKPTRLGLVWESYGFAPSDTVRITVQIVNAKDASLLRRVGMALGVADDPTTSVAIRWEEPQAPAARTILPTTVPTIARQLVMNIERLRAGDYVLGIAMEKFGCEPVRSERAFRVER